MYLASSEFFGYLTRVHSERLFYLLPYSTRSSEPEWVAWKKTPALDPPRVVRPNLVEVLVKAVGNSGGN